MGLESPFELTGLYDGAPLTERSEADVASLPAAVWLYRRPILEEWMNSQEGLFSYTPPQASAVSFIRYHMDINSTELMERLCREASVFVGAGDSFGMDHHLRIAFGQEREGLEEAFSRIEKTLKSVAA